MELKKISIFETAPLTVYKSFYWNPLLSLFLTAFTFMTPSHCYIFNYCQSVISIPKFNYSQS